MQIDCVQHGTVEVQLEPVVGRIAYTYGPGAHVPVEVGKLLLGKLRATFHTVDRSELPAHGSAAIEEPAHEVVRLLAETELDEGVDGEPGIA